MKKYIRTENNIYQNDPSYLKKVTLIEKNCEESPCLEINLGSYSTYDFLPMTRYERIIKESDAIEELCDVFIAFKSCKDYGILEAEDYITGSKWEMEDYYNKGYQVHGAIWCDFGLKYVAKMDKEGNLIFYENERRTI